MTSSFCEKVCSRPGSIASRIKRGFTLVELLVVIGIIALLISILLPALSKAREQGNWVACMSNMKQIGTGLLMYANENKQYLPRPASNGNGQFPDDLLIWREPPTAPSTSVDDSVLATLLTVKGEKFRTLFQCPSDPADRKAAQGPGYHFSYTMNKAWDPDRSKTEAMLTRPRPKMSEVRRPSEKVCLAEEKNPNDGRFEWGNLSAGTSDDQLNDRHAKQGNILFTDWHVERRFWKELKDPVDLSTSSPKGVGTYLDPFDGKYTANLQ